MKEITYSNILDLVNSRSISRKEKKLAISRFLKQHSGEKKPTSPEEIEVLEKLTAIRKTYVQQDKLEK